MSNSLEHVNFLGSTVPQFLLIWADTIISQEIKIISLNATSLKKKEVPSPTGAI